MSSRRSLAPRRRKGAVADDDARKIGEAFDALYRSIPPQGDKNAAQGSARPAGELLPLVKLSATGSRLYAKPRGYAGDYQTIDMIYDNEPAGVGPIGALLDGCVLNLPAAKAIRNRRRLLAAEILSSYRTAAKEFHVASLACGPAREIFDVFEKADDKGRLHVSCIDVDREALTHIGARCQKQRARRASANAAGEPDPTRHRPAGAGAGAAGPDLRHEFHRLLERRAGDRADQLDHDKLRPGGRVILGNFHPRNPTRGFMDHVLDWHLTHRDEAEMNQLFAGSKFARPCSRIFFEEEGIDLFAEARKP